MAKGPEMKVHDWLRKEMKKRYGTECVYIKAPAGVYSSRRGISDFIYCVRGIFVAIEVKVEGKEPTLIQQNFLNEVIVAGGIGLCLQGKDETIFGQINVLIKERAKELALRWKDEIEYYLDQESLSQE